MITDLITDAPFHKYSPHDIQKIKPGYKEQKDNYSNIQEISTNEHIANDFPHIKDDNYLLSETPHKKYRDYGDISNVKIEKPSDDVYKSFAKEEEKLNADLAKTLEDKVKDRSNEDKMEAEKDGNVIKKDGFSQNL